jgi:RNA polymerase primary sigma factor
MDSEIDVNWLRELCRHPLLSADDERTLFERLAAGDETARDELVTSNQKLVMKIARRFQGRGVELYDLFQEGNIGLLTAIRKFDVTRGHKFSTYATWWIGQSVSRAIYDYGRVIRLPVHRHEALTRLRAAEMRLLVRGETVTRLTLAEEAGLDEALIDHLHTICQTVRSLDAPLRTLGTDGHEVSLADLVPDAGGIVTETAELSDLRVSLLRAMEKLDERSRLILTLRFGLDDGRPRSLEEVGQIVGVTRERIRQIEEESLRRLRHPATGRGLRAYLEAA